ncbi:MAG TPA: YitT family protein [Firmicutes bacterium]|uniref:YitT family protein n=1 Tax=Capillibacterium thermochitinicola TaxID=2699427 RepID=A0A8J6HZA9_9FIRM|nr:YitT family protein [Capillibacterium thermochitinicola]MBA2132645.1 YitT family protein [Capillibacterium thermochitinicola]HHW12818.1 YitT family protein [Bacillota bacterium]
MAKGKGNGGRLKREFIDYLGVFLGVNLTALGLVWFLIPNKIAAGGVSGVATILYYLFQWPVGAVILLVNIPLFLACLLVFGPAIGMKTVFGTVLLAAVVEYWGALVHPLTLDPLLGALWGGVLAGAGVGVTLRYHGTTGGTDLAAKLLAHFSALSMGQAVLLLDGLVIAMAGLVFKSVDLMLYALISIVVSGKIIDGVLDGFNYSKGVYIISDRSEQIAQRVLNELNRGVTGLAGRGIYSGKHREVLLCVIGRTEEMRLKRLVKEEDPNAFVIITNVHEVLGEGFKE